MLEELLAAVAQYEAPEWVWCRLPGRNKRSVKGVQPVAMVRISHDGRVVIPADIRRALGLKDGDVVYVRLVDREVVITSAREALHHARSIARKYVTPGQSLADELIADRRREAQRD